MHNNNNLDTDIVEEKTKQKLKRDTMIGEEKGVRNNGKFRKNAKKYRGETRNKMKIATWNVRSLKQDGKIENILQEMERLEVDIVGISETYYKEDLTIKIGLPDKKEDYTLVNSGSDDNRKGVAFIYNRKFKKIYEFHKCISNRIILMKLNTKPRKTLLIQVYAPTEDTEIGIKEEFYENLSKAVRENKKYGERIIICGDFNAKVGNEREEGIIGPFGLGNRNENGDLLVDFCREFKMVVTNTWFEQKESDRHTWISPDGRTKNQIDYVLINHRYRNSITDSKSRPEADCGSDHNPVVTSITTRLKNTKKARETRKCNFKKLKEPPIRVKFQTLLNEKMQDSHYENNKVIWEEFKSDIKETINEVCGEEEMIPKKKWMTLEILKKMEERRNQKNIDQGKYQEIHREVKRMCREAKDKYYEEICQKIQELDERHNPLMYQIIKEINPKRKSAINAIQNQNGRIVTAKEDILSRFAEYIEKLYEEEIHDLPELEQSELQIAENMNPISEEEIETIIKGLKNDRSTGVDEIPAEALKCLDSKGISVITKMINDIYVTGEIPPDFKECIYIPIPKEKKAEQCSQFRTISLITHASKILLQVIKKRITPIIERQLTDNQMGFRKGKGTRDGIFQLRQLTERMIEKNKNLYAAFIDYSKAFDKVKHQKLIEILKKAGIPEVEIRLIVNLYWGQTAVVRIDNETSENFPISKGVRQGCILSPILFNLYTNYMIEEAFEDLNGIRINGENITNIRYADDTVLLAENEGELQILMTALNDKCEGYGMVLNEKKTKVMLISKEEPYGNLNITINGKKLQEVKGYNYLGSFIDREGKCNKEIKMRIGNAKNAFLNNKEIFRNNISKNTKKRLLNCYVFSVLSYGCESWTLTKDSLKRIEAFEMWLYRRMLRISYKDRVTNEEVLNRMQTKRNFVERISKRKMRYAGHVMRGSSGVLALNILEGFINGKKEKGRPRRNWIDDIKDWIGEKSWNVNYAYLKRNAENREYWRTVVANIRRSSVIK